MNINFKTEEQTYKMINAIKKSGPGGKSFIEAGVLFNQKVLTACGKIHAALLQLSDEEAEKFKSDNKEFFDGFAWVYYMDWKKQKAKSCAHLLDVYSMLNVKLGIQDFVGETFYAGIPLTTAAEVNEAIQTCQVAKDGVTPIGPEDAGFDHAKIGIDGQLHKTDKYGEFEPWSDNNDIYSDGTGVTKVEMDAIIEAENKTDTPCVTCKWTTLGCNSQCDEGCEAYEKI